jgi:hypothetical protein
LIQVYITNSLCGWFFGLHLHRVLDLQASKAFNFLPVSCSTRTGSVCSARLLDSARCVMRTWRAAVQGSAGSGQLKGSRTMHARTEPRLLSFAIFAAGIMQPRQQQKASMHHWHVPWHLQASPS